MINNLLISYKYNAYGLKLNLKKKKWKTNLQLTVYKFKSKIKYPIFFRQFPPTICIFRYINPTKSCLYFGTFANNEFPVYII